MPVLIIFFVASIVFTMVGFGGGSVYVPLFTFLGYRLKEFSIPASIFLIFLSSLAAVVNYVKHNLIDYSAGIKITLSTIFFAFITKMIFFDNISARFLWVMLGLVITVLGLKMYMPETNIRLKLRTEKSKNLYYVLIGVIIGFLSISIGFGGGSIMVPMLILISFDVKVAIGTSSFIIMTTALPNFLVHFFTTFEKDKMSDLFIASLLVMAGGYVGSKLTSVKLSKKTIRIVMATLLTGLGLYILIEK